MPDLTERTLSSTELYHGKVVRLFVDTAALPNGRTATREKVVHPGGVCIVPLTDENEVLMVRQFRYPFGRVLLEAPAGKLDPGEDVKAAALRELSEETGASAQELCPLGEFYPSVGYTDEVIHLFLARGLSFGSAHPDDDEFLNVERIPLAALVADILDGTLPDGKTQSAILKTHLLLEAERRGR